MRLGAKSRKIMGFFDLFKKKKDNTAPAATPEEQAIEAQEVAREEQAQKEELAEGLQSPRLVSSRSWLAPWQVARP